MQVEARAAAIAGGRRRAAHVEHAEPRQPCVEHGGERVEADDRHAADEHVASRSSRSAASALPRSATHADASASAAKRPRCGATWERTDASPRGSLARSAASPSMADDGGPGGGGAGGSTGEGGISDAALLSDAALCGRRLRSSSRPDGGTVNGLLREVEEGVGGRAARLHRTAC